MVLSLHWHGWHAEKKASQQAKTTGSHSHWFRDFSNINEPTMFGIPVVLNILLLLPFVLAPIVNLILAYWSDGNWSGTAYLYSAWMDNTTGDQWISCNRKLKSIFASDCTDCSRCVAVSSICCKCRETF